MGVRMATRLDGLRRLAGRVACACARGWRHIIATPTRTPRPVLLLIVATLLVLLCAFLVGGDNWVRSRLIPELPNLTCVPTFPCLSSFQPARERRAMKPEAGVPSFTTPSPARNNADAQDGAPG